tara:strand:+ start:1347 stop:1919 length:573 start_codon:yes stop_codon:yes gene_type:complete
MIRKIFQLILFLSLITFFLNGCGIYKRSDVKDNPVEVDKRIKKNLEEGKGIRFNVGGKKNGGVFDFASSNEMWRATIETLDFVSFTNASYSGGIIITDWFSGTAAGDTREMKITVRFLSNEIRAEGIQITIHERKCDENKINCKIVRKKSKLENEIKLAILKKAAKIQKNEIDKNTKKKRKLPRLPQETN